MPPAPVRTGQAEAKAHEAQGGTTADLLLALFTAFEHHGIRYCVLHSYEELPFQIRSDVDLAIHPRDHSRLPAVLGQVQNLGFPLVQQLHYAVGAEYLVFAWFNGIHLQSVAIDIITEHRRDGWLLMSGVEMVENRVQRGTFWAASAEVEFHYLLVKKAWKSHINHRQQQRIAELERELGPLPATLTACRLFGEEGAQLLLSKVEQGDLAERLPRLRHLMFAKARRTGTGAWLTGQCRNLARAARRWWFPTGLFVAVLGPDGVGKSSLLEQLQKEQPGFRRTRRFHWRPMLLQGRRRPTGSSSPQACKPDGMLVSSIRLFLHWIDYWAGYFAVVRPLLVRSGLVLFDRYYDDLLIDPRRFRYGGPRWLAHCLLRVTPRPDLLLILDAPPHTVASRKNELTEPELRKQRQAYREWRDAHPETCLVDASSTAAEVQSSVMKLLAGYMNSRMPAALRG